MGLRDWAVIGVMTYAFARIGAMVAMRVEDYFANGKRWWVRLHEKGGKRSSDLRAPSSFDQYNLPIEDVEIAQGVLDAAQEKAEAGGEVRFKRAANRNPG